jgi:predicted Zn-dependent protease
MIKLAKLHYQRLGNRPKAMDLARAARALAPDDPSVAHALGRIAFDAGEPAEMQWAHSLLQESARRLPEDPEVAYDLAWSHYSVGQIPEAEAAMRSAVKRTFPQADEGRRFLKFTAANPSETDIQAALQQQPTYVPALVASAIMHERQNQPAPARKAYETVLARFPLFVPAHKRLAAIYEGQGEMAKAFDHAAKARERAPNDPEAAKILGIIVFKRGEYSRAALLLGEGARQRASDAELFYYLGLAHYRLKQVTESRVALRQAVALKIAAPMAEEANRLLAEMN